MKLSLDWLAEFVTFTEKDPQTIANAITAHTAEVDDVERQGALLDRVVVGKVLSVGKHPQADRLSLCTVQTDDGVKKVVCGGSNLRNGMRVALAHVGARVRWHGTDMVTLEKAKIRGEESEGMICTAEELDLLGHFPQSKERTLIDLGDGDEGVGSALRAFLGLNDVVFHVDNHAITHRADLFSHLGFARELVAIGMARWRKERKTKHLEPKAFPKAPIPFKMSVEEKNLMPRYSACLLEIESLGETPDWMKKRLEATGWRSVNLPVDITNYVLMEIGVPLHSFDADDIRGNVTMRRAKKGEQITVLDGSTLSLPEGALVLSDEEGIFDLLGIMGGLRSSTKVSTKRIYLHSASLDPHSIRRAVHATGHRTDASTVYEKGVPPVVAELGFFRALALMLQLIPGAKIASRLESYGDNGKPKPIELAITQVSRVLGVEIPQKTIEKILTDLEFDVARKKKNTLKITPPLHRLGDIRGEHDLVEEIGRIYGFNKIEPETPQAPIEPPLRDLRIHQLRDALKTDGFIEILPLSLVSPGLLQKTGLDLSKTVEIENPLGEELSLLQPSLLPSLLAHAQKNLPLVQGTLRTFQRGHVFEVSGYEVRGAGFSPNPENRDSQQQCERDELSLFICTKEKTSLKNDPLLQAKQSLTHALQRIGFAIDITPVVQVPAHAHPGRFATLSALGASIGMFYELHPDIRQRFNIPGRAAVATLDLTTLLSLQGTIPKAEPLPQFPGVTYDETVTLTHDERVGETLKELAKRHELLESADIIDLFDSGRGKYNLTARFVYRAPDRTLTEDEAKEEHRVVMKELAN